MSSQSREIIEILADVVRVTAKDCVVNVFNGVDFEEVRCPDITYMFGNAQYLKDRCDARSKSYLPSISKFPLIYLFAPFAEQRNLPEYYSKSKVRLIIACSTDKEYSNEQRLVCTFRNILRPIYRSFLEALKEDGRLDFGYEEVIPHKYSENYSYGRYGALTPTGEEVSEPIDAIVISDLELKVKLPNC